MIPDSVTREISAWAPATNYAHRAGFDRRIPDTGCGSPWRTCQNANPRVPSSSFLFARASSFIAVIGCLQFHGSLLVDDDDACILGSGDFESGPFDSRELFQDATGLDKSDPRRPHGLCNRVLRCDWIISNFERVNFNQVFIVGKILLCWGSFVENKTFKIIIFFLNFPEFGFMKNELRKENIYENYFSWLVYLSKNSNNIFFLRNLAAKWRHRKGTPPGP